MSLTMMSPSMSIEKFLGWKPAENNKIETDIINLFLPNITSFHSGIQRYVLPLECDKPYAASVGTIL